MKLLEENIEFYDSFGRLLYFLEKQDRQLYIIPTHIYISKYGNNYHHNYSNNVLNEFEKYKNQSITDFYLTKIQKYKNGDIILTFKMNCNSKIKIEINQKNYSVGKDTHTSCVAWVDRYKRDTLFSPYKVCNRRFCHIQKTK